MHINFFLGGLTPQTKEEISKILEFDLCEICSSAPNYRVKKNFKCFSNISEQIYFFY